MRAWQRARIVGGAAVLSGMVAAAHAAPPCDEYNPHSPVRTGNITLHAGDATGPNSNELRTFVETGSIGKVDITVVSANPKGVRAVSASPEISRLSPLHGEQLKGIAIVVDLWDHQPKARVVLKLRQVCADHFRDTFLYY